MNRQKLLQQIKETKRWDIIVIGGGATGLGVAVDSATRGFRTLLLEADDFSKGTSSRSTKLVHGGVRYLEQGDIPLVLEALRERTVVTGRYALSTSLAFGGNNAALVLGRRA